MARYLHTNVSRRTLKVGDRWVCPGEGFWADERECTEATITSAVRNNDLVVTQVDPPPTPQPVAAPAPVAKPVAKPVVAPPPEPKPSTEDEEFLEDYTESELSVMRVAELREIAEVLDISTTGLKKNKLIAAILEGS